MNTELETRWNDLVKAREEFLEAFKDLSDDQQRSQPQDAWSANQVLEHILIAETGTLGYMKKKSSSGCDILEKTGEEHIQKSKAVNTRLQLPDRYQAPSVLTDPTNNYSFDQLNAQWNLIREDMKNFIGNVDEKHYDKLVFRQPIAGMLNLLQAMEFMIYHIRHHIPQIQRIKEAKGF